jgi:hypothetical protein
VLLVEELDCELVIKNGPRLIKGNPMFPEIGSRFCRVPFKFNHQYIVWIAALKSRRAFVGAAVHRDETNSKFRRGGTRFTKWNLKASRNLADRPNNMKNQAEKATIFCYGGCGRSVTLRKSKVHHADFYLCETRQDGDRCRAKLPPLMPGKVRATDMHAAASFWGYTDEWMDAEHAAGVMRAQAILEAGLAQWAIEKAMRR